MDNLDLIKRNAEKLLNEIPEGVTLLAAAKTRTAQEVRAAWQGGVRCFGHNYVQEAQAMLPGLELDIQWHLIGHLQRNKAKNAVDLFNVVETLDSTRLAQELDKRCAQAGKVLPVMIEVNSGREKNKDGVLPEEVDAMVSLLASLEHLRLCGLMTMGPLTGDPQLSRPYFQTTREIFERVKKENPELIWLSMGMSHSYRVAIEEGANLVRIGTALFGPRK